MKFNFLAKSVVFLAVIAAMAATAFAGVNPPAPVPEVDPFSIQTAVTLLVGGYLVVISRSRRK